MAEIGDVTEVTDILQGAYEINWKIPKFSTISVENGEFYVSPPFSFAGESWSLRIYPDGRLKDFIGCIGIYLLKRTGSSAVRIDLTLGLKDFNGVKVTEHHRTYTFAKISHGVPDCMSRKGLLTRKFTLMPDDVLTVFCNLKYPDATKSSDWKDNVKSKYKEASPQTQEEKNLESLSQDFKQVLLDGSNHDLIFKVRNTELRAHRDILKARSKVFYSMLTHDMLEKNGDPIEIPDCDPEAMKLFLLYVYCGRVEGLNQSNMLKLYYIADKFEVLSLKVECHNFIKESLSAANFCDIIQLALNHSDSSLLEYAMEYFLRNTLAILKTVKWQSFLKTHSIVANELIIKSPEIKK